jgi:hypothetical protein
VACGGASSLDQARRRQRGTSGAGRGEAAWLDLLELDVTASRSAHGDLRSKPARTHASQSVDKVLRWKFCDW